MCFGALFIWRWIQRFFIICTEYGMMPYVEYVRTCIMIGSAYSPARVNPSVLKSQTDIDHESIVTTDSSKHAFELSLFLYLKRTT